MKYEHKAIIDAATREGKLPMEKARELMGHDLLKAMVTTISGHAVAFKNMSEQQQDAAIQSMQAELAPAIDTAIRLISSQATKTVRMKLKKVAIGKKWQIVGEAEGDEEYLHELADKTQDQSDVLVLLYERDYLQGLDAIHGEKDQKDLPLSHAEPKATKAKADKAPKAKKEIIIDDATLDRGRSFVVEFSNSSIAGLQSQLKIGYEKANAILKTLEGEGIVAWSGDDVNGQYELVRSKLAPTDKSSKDEASSEEQADLAPTGAGTVSFDTIDELTDDLYDKIKAKVIADQSVSAGALSVAFDCEFEVAELAIERLETEGVVGEEDDMGGREVLQAA